MKQSDSVRVCEDIKNGVLCWALYCGHRPLTDFQPYDIKQMTLINITIKENTQQSSGNGNWLGDQRK